MVTTTVAGDGVRNWQKTCKQFVERVLLQFTKLRMKSNINQYIRICTTLNNVDILSWNTKPI